MVLAVVSAMLAGNWRPARMVAHYSAGAKYLCRERLGPELGRWFTNR